jgi:DnaK suppressor protein
MISKDDLAYFEDLLRTQLAELERRAGGAVGSLLLSSVFASDPVDSASLDADRDYTLRIRDRESKLIRKIQAALDRIEEGTYGECDLCGEDIGVARLRARPVATHCIQCKTRLESLEKVSGF